jgi:3-isopropylmalate/(R)-2-methylmalate dehydratase small subunit
VDLTTSSLKLPGGKSVAFPIEPFARYCLMQGVDQLGYLMLKNDAITAYEKQHA